MEEKAVDLAAKLGPLIALIGLILWLFFGPDAQKDFNQRIDNRLVEVEAQLKTEREERRAADKQHHEEKLALQNENLELRSEINEVRAQLLAFFSTQDSLPWAAWFKDTNGKVLYANRAYEEKFLLPRGYTLSDYVGHDDYAVWPKETADAFRANDQEIMRTGRYQVFPEPIPMGDGQLQMLPFAKYARRSHGNIIIGVAGMEIPGVQP